MAPFDAQVSLIRLSSNIMSSGLLIGEFMVIFEIVAARMDIADARQESNFLVVHASPKEADSSGTALRST